jgi:hypothetical protein
MYILKTHIYNAKIAVKAVKTSPNINELELFAEFSRLSPPFTPGIFPSTSAGFSWIGRDVSRYSAQVGPVQVHLHPIGSQKIISHVSGTVHRSELVEGGRGLNNVGSTEGQL